MKAMPCMRNRSAGFEASESAIPMPSTEQTLIFLLRMSHCAVCGKLFHSSITGKLALDDEYTAVMHAGKGSECRNTLGS